MKYVTNVKTAMNQAKAATGKKDVLVHGARTGQLGGPPCVESPEAVVAAFAQKTGSLLSEMALKIAPLQHVSH